jgi:urease accessory protein
MALIAPLPLSRLLQLASPMLPVGAYSYSQGFEAAIESGIAHDADTAREWIADVLDLYLARFELPLLWRMHGEWASGGDPAPWNAIFHAGRDTAEARAETLQTGYSLVRLIESLEACDHSRHHPHPGSSPGQALASPIKGEGYESIDPVTYPLAYAFISAKWGIPAEAAAHAYAWSWLENQVAVAMKAIPIGQVAGQRILLALGGRIPEIVETMPTFDDDDIGNFAPGLSLAGCRHETQYSRLFRS